MKYLLYVCIAMLVDGIIFLSIWLFSSRSYATQIAIIVFPLAIWTARLIVAWRSGLITRRFKMLDGGAVFKGNFWSFFPEVYQRRQGFDNFKGYFVKEVIFCGFCWMMFLSIPILKVLHDMGFPVR